MIGAPILTAWLGGVVIDHGPGLNSLFLVAAVLPLIAIGVIGFSAQVVKNFIMRD